MVFFFFSAFLITLKCLVLEKFWTIRSLQSSAVIYLLCCSPPGIMKVMIQYNSSKCIMESFCGGDSLNISSLQDFSTVLFWMCSMKLIDPVSWISHWKTFARVSVDMLRPIYCDWKTMFFKREKKYMLFRCITMNGSSNLNIKSLSWIVCSFYTFYVLRYNTCLFISQCLCWNSESISLTSLFIYLIFGHTLRHEGS